MGEKDIEDLLNDLRSEIAKMHGIALLEWHDKNLLSGTNSTRFEDHRNRLNDMLETIDRVEKQYMHDVRGVKVAKDVGVL